MSERRKWEYITERISLEEVTAERLDVYGADGWELVAVYVWEFDAAADLIFKREVMP